MWEKMQLMLMQNHFAQLQHLPEANFSRQRNNNAIRGDVVATARCRWVAHSAEFKHKLNNLPLSE
jgi:hypothetical protein